MKRIAALDGVRGIAILQVVIYHYFTWKINPAPGSLLAYLQLPTFLFWGGVDIFFVLSGYLMGSILLMNRDAENYYKVFFIRRICRIIPLYAIVVSSVVLLEIIKPAGFESLYGGPVPAWSYMTFTQNIMVAKYDNFGNPVLGITWALAVIAQFTLILPFLIRNLSLKNTIFLSIALIVISPVLRHLFRGDIGPYVLTYCRGDSLMTGVLLATVMNNEKGKRIVFQYRTLIFLLFAALSVVVLFILPVYDRWKGGAVNHLILAFYFGLIVIIAHFPDNVFTDMILNNKALAWIGARSYGIFLMHQGVAAGLAVSLKKSHLTVNDIAVCFLSIPVTLFLADMSLRLFESKFISFGHRFNYRFTQST
jgi:peptidoglycan/LPS O-acetylase OafA/YrhL